MGNATRFPDPPRTSKKEVCAYSDTKTSTSEPQCRRRRKRSTIRQVLTVSTDVALLGIGLAGAAAIERYSALSTSTRPNHDGLMTLYLPRLSRSSMRLQMKIQEAFCNGYLSKDIISYISSQFDRLHIYQLLENPPPLLFFIACTCLAFAVSGLQYRYGSERYHTRLIVAGGTIGIVLAALGPGDFVMGMKGYLARSIMTALICSYSLHRFLKLWGDIQGRGRDG